MKQFYMVKFLFFFFSLLILDLEIQAQNGPNCSTYTNKTTANGLSSNYVRKVYAVGSTVYAVTDGGLSISTNGGTSFYSRNYANGLSFYVYGVYAVGSIVYVATGAGLSISTDGGTSFSTRTIANGLGSNFVYGVYAVGSTVYTATDRGLSISTDGGATFTNKTTANGLGGNTVNGVYVVGNTVYAATDGGLSISTDGGGSFFNKTTTNGLGSKYVNEVYVVGSTVYVATGDGLSISTDGGATFTNKTYLNGLGGNYVNGVYAVGSTVYAAMNGGLSISTDGGGSFFNKTTANGLGDNFVRGVYAVGGILYAATNGGLSFCSDPLPVRLIYFSGRSTSAGNQLAWQTSFETDNAHFLLERSIDARAFEPIAQFLSLASGGRSSQPLSYNFTDTHPPALSYYRLQQVDYSGLRTPSAIIAVRSENLSVLYPNPTAGAIELVLEPALLFRRYQLLDAGGRVVIAISEPGQLGQLSVAHLPAGSYMLVIEGTDGQQHTYRFIR